MVNPNAGGDGDNEKGKGKMVFESSDDTSNSIDRDGIPFLHPIYYERLAESLHKQLLEVKAWKERSVKEAEGKEKEESPVGEVEEEDERMKKIRAEICALKLGDNSWEQGMMEVERDCVMCLSVEKAVAFLPCAHMALCQDCNVVHQRLGMNDCPTCRTPISKRIIVLETLKGNGKRLAQIMLSSA
nr:putative E3 ubiquitin-protein ligase RF4 [Ipomoea trifida]